jgi:gluconolactonase
MYTSPRPALIALCLSLLAPFPACPADTLTLPDSLINPADTTEQLIATGRSAEGPAVAPDGTVYFTLLNSGLIVWVAPDLSNGTLSNSAVDQPNGLAFDALGRLVACDRGRVWRTELAGTATTVLTVPGSSNDIALTADGGMYVTVPVWDGLGTVWYQPPQGASRKVLDSVADFPNGIEVVQERGQVYIGYTQNGAIRRYDIGVDGGLSDAGIAVEATSPDGMALDTLGNVWVADFGLGRIDVFSPQGDTLGFLQNARFGSSVQNCCFGGPGSHTLYIAAQAGLFRVRTQAAGRDTRGGVVAARPDVARPRASQQSVSPSGISSGRYLLDGRRGMTGGMPRLERPAVSTH